MTPLVLVLALAEPAEPAEPFESAFGRRSTAEVRSLDPDGNRHQGDGAYGRFDGDLDLGLGAGGLYGLSRREASVAVRGSVRWYSAAALYAQFAETLSQDPGIERRLSAGVELTPLFLIRWSQALENGPALLDLTVDSLSLGLGALFTTPEGRGFASRKKFEGTLGLGVPLLATASGPWLELRASLVFPHALPAESSAALLFTWHAPVETPLVRGE